MLLLCFSFPMTIAMRSLLLDDTVWDWENIQLPSVNTSAGFVLSRDANKCSRLCLDSNKEGILGIALWELSRITQIDLHCTCHESSSLFFHWMGCRHYFCCRSAWRSCRWGWLSIFFTSSRTREFSACFTTACGNPDTLKSMSISSSWGDQCPPTSHPVLTRSASTSLSVFLSLQNVEQTNWYSRSQVRNVYRFPEHSNGTFVLSQQVALFCELDLGLVGLVGSFLLVEQLLNPIPSSNYFSRKSSEAVEVIHILFRIWFFQFPS